MRNLTNVRIAYVLHWAAEDYVCVAVNPEIIKERVLPIMKRCFRNKPWLTVRILEQIDEWAHNIKQGRTSIAEGIILSTEEHQAPDGILSLRIRKCA